MKQGKHNRTEAKQKQQPKKGHPLRRGIGYLIFAVVYLYVSTSLWIFEGPFSALRNYVIDTVDETRHGYLLRPMSLFLLPESVIEQHAQANEKTASIPYDKIQKEDFSNISDNTIKIEHYQGSTFNADIMLVRDPKRLRVAVTKYIGKQGQTVQQMVKDTGAVAGINGGSFNDANFEGTGAIPVGITIVNGHRIAGSTSQAESVVGFTNTGQLIAGNYSYPELQSLGVTQALHFPGTVIVENGRNVAPVSSALDPRTAIGQRKDGTVIMIVTSGRGVGGLGASYAEVANLMIQYGATIAAKLDGGSSTTMVHNGKLVNTPVDFTGARYVASAFVVMPETGGSGNG